MQSSMFSTRLIENPKWTECDKIMSQILFSEQCNAFSRLTGVVWIKFGANKRCHFGIFLHFSILLCYIWRFLRRVFCLHSFPSLWTETEMQLQPTLLQPEIISCFKNYERTLIKKIFISDWVVAVTNNITTVFIIVVGLNQDPPYIFYPKPDVIQKIGKCNWCILY